MTLHDPALEPRKAGALETAPIPFGRLTRWLIRSAVRSAPAELCERLEEEWLADLATRRPIISRLRFAIGCCWAVHVIASEHGASPVAVASPAAGAKLSVPWSSGDSDFFSRNSLTVIAVICFHIAIVYALMVGLGFKPPSHMIPLPFQAQVITTSPPPSQWQRLPAPRFSDIPLDVRRPEIDDSTEFEDPVRVTAQTDQGPSGASIAAKPEPVSTHDVSRVVGGPGAGFPATDDFYPSAAKRMEEQGITTVRVCVDLRGRLTSAPITIRSSGYPRLDLGALQLARAGSGHYRASTEDGRPVDSCYEFRVRFALKD
jgi:TonB family protein